MKELALEPALVEGRGGVFDVVVDGEVIFSKRAAHRFPNQEEILDRLRERRPYGG